MINSPAFTLDEFEVIDDANVYYSQSLTTTIGNVNIPLDRPFVYDGSSGILMEFCFDNSSWTDADQVFTVLDDRPTSLISFADGDQGCSLMFATSTSDVPLIVFEVRSQAVLLSDTERVFATSIAGGESAYMSSGDSNLAIVDADPTNALDCISLGLAADDRSFVAGDGFSAYGRILSFDSESPTNTHTITFWVPDVTDQVDINSYQVGYLPTWNGSFDDIQDEITMVPIDSIVTTAGSNVLTFPAIGNGVYFLTDFFVSTADVDPASETYDQVVYYDLAGRRIAQTDQLPTGIYIKTYMLKNRIVKSEKVFLLE